MSNATTFDNWDPTPQERAQQWQGKALELQARLDKTEDLLRRWQSQHAATTAANPCGVSQGLIDETNAALAPSRETPATPAEALANAHECPECATVFTDDTSARLNRALDLLLRASFRAPRDHMERERLLRPATCCAAGAPPTPASPEEKP